MKKMVSVKEIMTKEPVCVESSDLVTRARSLIRKYGYRALPVLEKGKLVGIISRGNILKITSSKTNISVEGIMNRNLITVSEDDDIFSAAKAIVRSGVRQLLVVDNGNLKGIISSMDILDKFVKEDYHPVKKKIDEVMTTDVVYCEQDDEISKIWDMMHSSGFSGLPVLKNNKIIGIVTRMNILKQGSVRLSKESGKIRNAPVKRVMMTPAITVTPATGVKRAAGTMVKRRIIRLPVVDKKKELVGIVDIEDILRAYVG